MTEEDIVDLLLEYLQWEDSLVCRYHLVRWLRQARGQPAPTFDDYKVGRE